MPAACLQWQAFVTKGSLVIWNILEGKNPVFKTNMWIYAVCSLPRAPGTEVEQSSKRTRVFTHDRGAGVQSQGVGWLCSVWRLRGGEGCWSRPFSWLLVTVEPLAQRHCFSVSFHCHMAIFLLCVFLFSCKDVIHVGLTAHPSPTCST